MNQKHIQNPMTLLHSSYNILLNHPNILHPIVILGFIQLIALEILYFSIRFPLNSFFSPIIKVRWDQSFLHYPLNLLLLPSLLYEAQVVIYILAGGLLMATAVVLIHAANTEKRVGFSVAFKEALRSYVHIFINSALSFVFFIGYNYIYQLILARALKIHSESGPFLCLKRRSLQEIPIFNLLWEF